MNPDTVQPQPDYAETVVTIELHDISLKELIDFLRDVESSASLARVGTLHIRKDPQSETQLDSTVEICSPKLGQPALAYPNGTIVLTLVTHHPARARILRRWPFFTLRGRPKIL